MNELIPAVSSKAEAEGDKVTIGPDNRGDRPLSKISWNCQTMLQSGACGLLTVFPMKCLRKVISPGAASL